MELFNVLSAIEGVWDCESVYALLLVCALESIALTELECSLNHIFLISLLLLSLFKCSAIEQAFLKRKVKFKSVNCLVHYKLVI